MGIKKSKMGKLGISYKKLTDLKPYERNAKNHPAAQVKKIAASITEFGFLIPILVDGAGEIIAGHGRLLAAESLELKRSADDCNR